MALELCTHKSQQEPPEYLALKRKMIGAGLFSCSQRGFNIAMGPLVGLQATISKLISGLDTGAEHWEVPPMIRSDWVHWKVWNDPGEAQWCFEQPGGNILTPRPLLHLVNRLRHHPVDDGTWLVMGSCVRNEDAEQTLPLLRQRAFRMLEYVRLADAATGAEWSRCMLDQLWQQFVKLDLPVEMIEIPGVENGNPGIAINLQLKAAEEVSLVRSWEVSTDLLAAYKLGNHRMWTVGIGPERISLGILARWGVAPDGWPEFN